MRRDLKAKRWIENAGSVMALVGLGAMGGAAEGRGNLLVAISVFVVGFAIVLWGYKR